MFERPNNTQKWVPIPDRMSGNWGFDNNVRFCFCHFVSQILSQSNVGIRMNENEHCAPFYWPHFTIKKFKTQIGIYCKMAKRKPGIVPRGPSCRTLSLVFAHSSRAVCKYKMLAYTLKSFLGCKLPFSIRNYNLNLWTVIRQCNNIPCWLLPSPAIVLKLWKQVAILHEKNGSVIF